MRDLARYTSFDELKDSSDGIDTDVDKLLERHERFVEAMHFLRNEYLQSRTLSENNASEGIETMHDLR